MATYIQCKQLHNQLSVTTIGYLIDNDYKAIWKLIKLMH